MRLAYEMARTLDRAAAIFRAVGLQPLTRRCRELLTYVFGEGISIEVDDLRLCGSLRDRAFLYKLKEGRFEPETVKLFVGALRPGMVVLDVGAYLGYYTFLAARQVGEKGKVYAFEPDPSSYRFLEHNIHLNGYSNIVAVSKAASSRGRIRNLYL